MALQGIEVEGVIIKEYPAKEGVAKSTGNPWKSQEFVIQTRDQYPRACLFRIFGADKLAQFNLHQGDNVKVYLDINARPWQDRYFNDINCFRVDHLDGQAPAADVAPGMANQQAAYAAPQAGVAQAPTAQPIAQGDSSDDLPF